jgi:hypothetical protein
MSGVKNNHGGTDGGDTRLRVAIRASVVYLSVVLLCSCGGNDHPQTPDSLSAGPATENVAPVPGDSAASLKVEQFKLSPEDSLRVADSVARYRNAVRDFE